MLGEALLRGAGELELLQGQDHREQFESGLLVLVVVGWLNKDPEALVDVLRSQTVSEHLRQTASHQQAVLLDHGPPVSFHFFVILFGQGHLTISVVLKVKFEVRALKFGL